jgi:hypothetical protein
MKVRRHLVRPLARLRGLATPVPLEAASHRSGAEEDKVVELVNNKDNRGYARTVIEREKPWLREGFPLLVNIEDMSRTLLSRAKGSTFQGVPKGADQIRQYPPRR